LPVVLRGWLSTPAGDVFVTDRRNNRVVKLAARIEHPQTVLPITGLQSPDGVAVDAAGNVYVADSSDHRGGQARGRVEHSKTVLPFNRPHRTIRSSHSHGLAVDTAGNVYFADGTNKRVLKLAAGSNTKPSCRSPGLGDPIAVAVDRQATSTSPTATTTRVVKLAAG